MKNRILIILVSGILFVSGCLKDKTNLDYKNVILPDSVIVTNLADQSKAYYEEGVDNYPVYAVTVGEELKLDVEVKYRGNDQLTYEWQLDGKVISREQNLRYAFSQPGLLMLFVYRQAAGNATVYRAEISIRTPYKHGIAVLGKVKGQTRMDFVESFGSYKSVELEGEVNKNFYSIEYLPHENVYSLNNTGETLGANSFKIVYVGSYSSGYAVQILDKDWRNSVSLQAETLKKLVKMGDEFVEEPKNLKPLDFANEGATSLLLDESGKIYTRVNYDNAIPNTGRFSTEPLAYNDPNDVPDKGTEELKADEIISYDRMFIIYEKAKKRFLAMTASNGKFQRIDYTAIHSLSRISNSNNLPSGYVPLDNFDKELIAFRFHATFFNKHVYFIYREGDDCYIQTATINPSLYSAKHSVTHTAVSNIKLPNDVARLLIESKGRIKIGMNASYKDVLYMATDKALYSMTTSGTDIQKHYEFTQAGIIKDFVITSTWNATGNVMKRYFNGRVFGAIFDNGDFRVVKLYDDPQKPGEVQAHYYVNKNFDGGVTALCCY